MGLQIPAQESWVVHYQGLVVVDVIYLEKC